MAKLLGSADPMLVQAAAKAAAANVPADLSRIHERMSRSHALTMKTIGESWVKGVTAAMQVGQKLVEKAKIRGEAMDMMDAWSPEKPREAKEGETISFDDKKIKKWTNQLDVLKQQSEKMSGYPGVEKDYATNLEEQKKLEDKIAKRNAKLTRKDWSTRIYTDEEGNEERVEPTTIRGQITKVRKEIANLRLNKGDLTNEERNAEIDALKRKKDNLRSSVTEFAASLEVVKEQLKLDNIDIIASSYGVDGSLKMQFVHALLNESKPLGEDASYTDSDGEVISLAGARAQIGFTEDEGKMTFTFVGADGRPILKDNGDEMSIQKHDIQNLIISKNPAIIEGFKANTNAKTHRDMGFKNPTLAYDPSSTNNFIDNTVIDRNSALSAMNHSGGDMTMSLISALNGVQWDENGDPIFGSTEMSDLFWENLEALGLGSEWDIDGGGVTATDFEGDKGKENFIKLRDEALSGKDIVLIRQLLKANTNAQNEKHHADGVTQFENQPKQTDPLWKRLGFSDYGKYIDWKEGGIEYKNRNVDIDMYIGYDEGKDEDLRSKITTTSDAIIKWEKDLKALEKTGKDSIFSGDYVNINGVKYGWDPKHGFIEVEDSTGAEFGLWYKYPKNKRYFNNVIDIFQHHNIPTTYIGVSGGNVAELD